MIEHIIESQQFSVPKIWEIFDRAEDMKKIIARGGTKDYDNRILACLFYKPSTRTRFSFESAMARLGGKVLSTENAHEFSSEIRNEMLEDTIRIVSNYADAIVLRAVDMGGAQRAANVSKVPVINAGDGANGQHPTQALLDLYTIYQECKTIDGLSVLFAGELDTGRTVHSLAYLLGKFSRIKLYFVAPKELQIKQDILDYLDRRNVVYELAESSRGIIENVDVAYQTQIHEDRLKGISFDPSVNTINKSILSKMKHNSIILHPLPRSVEIDPEVDNDKRAAYFRQTENGLYIRMALLTMIFDHEL
jgi:aspartate carbamoyltransferase catalytic subunit